MRLEYEDRYVAFLDILGFREAIGRSVGPTPSVAIDDVIQALEVPEEVKLDGITLGRIGDISTAQLTLTAFSDSVAISSTATEQGLMNLLFHVRAILFRLLRLGFLSRGGIARGSAYHHDAKVFGPAIIEAWRLERDIAVFPRVILHPEIVDVARSAAPPINQLFERLTRRNDDGIYMVHSLWALRMAADSDIGFVGEWQDLVTGIGQFLADEEARFVAEPSRAHELEKIRWFRSYFDWATDRSWCDALQAPFQR